MKIIAIWERPQADARYGGIFCLLDSGQFLHLTQEREYNGTDRDGNRMYVDTGRPEWGRAFGENDRFDFAKANYWISNFGGKLVYLQNK